MMEEKKCLSYVSNWDDLYCTWSFIPQLHTFQLLFFVLLCTVNKISTDKARSMW